jgi:hypothetical protein
LKRYKDTNKSGEITWEEWKETAFHNWHTATERNDEKTWDNQSSDKETKTIGIHRNRPQQPTPTMFITMRILRQYQRHTITVIPFLCT